MKNIAIIALVGAVFAAVSCSQQQQQQQQQDVVQPPVVITKGK